MFLVNFLTYVTHYFYFQIYIINDRNLKIRKVIKVKYIKILNNRLLN